jgi:hypothetical protein
MVRNGILVVAALCIGLLAVELVARLYVRRARLGDKLDYLDSRSNTVEQRNIGRGDALLGWGLRPLSRAHLVTSDFDVKYEINSRGFRDREITLQKASHEFRVLLIGESMVMGHGVDYGERFSEVIESALRNVTVVNMGVWGYGMDQSLMQMERDGFQFDPDLVVLVLGCSDYANRCKYLSMHGRAKPVFILNKTRDDIVLRDIASLQQEFGPPKKAGPPAPASTDAPQQPLKTQSSLGFLVSYWNQKQRFKEEIKQRDQNEWERLTALRVHDPQYPYTAQEDFEQVLHLLLARYKRSCQAHGCRLMVVNAADSRDNSVEEHCKRLGIAYYDLSDVLIKASGKSRLRFAVDPHYNPFANRVIGEYLSDYLHTVYGLEQNSSYRNKWLGQF